MLIDRFHFTAKSFDKVAEVEVAGQETFDLKRSLSI